MKVLRMVLLVLVICGCLGIRPIHAENLEMREVIGQITDWGQKNGEKIIQAYRMGNWESWAEIDMGVYFIAFQNFGVVYGKTVEPKGGPVDLLLTVPGKKNIALGIVCENLPSSPNAYVKVLEKAQKMKRLNTEKSMQVVVGIMVSSAANNEAKYQLCDKGLFDSVQLYRSKEGYTVQLYFMPI